MLDVRHGCCQLGSQRGECCIPLTLTLSSSSPASAACWGKARVGSPHLRGGSFEAPRAKLCVLAQHGHLCFAALGPSAKCCVKGVSVPRTGGAPTQGQWCPQPPLASSSRTISVNAGLYVPVPVGSRVVETARGRNPLANKTVFLFTVGEQEFREVAWQEACTLAYWKIACPSADLMFFPSPLPISLCFSSSSQFLLPRPPQDAFSLSFPLPSTALPVIPHGCAGRGSQEDSRVPPPPKGCSTCSCESHGLSCHLRGCM